MFLCKSRWRTRKITFFLSATLLIALIFVVHQLLMFLQLTNDSKSIIVTTPKLKLIRGIHEQEAIFYIPDSVTKTFTCIKSMERIPFKWINDNYCDCLDGSDEPGTNACPNGIFYCNTQNFKVKSVPSSRVNDGICDCCDGSDEWDSKPLKNYHNGKDLDNNNLGKPCQNYCHN